MRRITGEAREFEGPGPGGFSPKAAVVAGVPPNSTPEIEHVVRARLRELPMIYILFLSMATFWRYVVLWDEDRLLHALDGSLIVMLGGIVIVLSSSCAIPLSRLKSLEMGIIGVLGCRVAIVEYRLVLLFSLRGDSMLAQLTVKNIVLLTTVLILTHGLYVPKTWRRAALVGGLMAVLPFATLGVLFLRHGEVMGWLVQGWRSSETPRMVLFGFDAMTLPIVAVGSAVGARAISRL
ncbi:serine/threonine-protein kinase, partial [Singulisphaera rosea]